MKAAIYCRVSTEDQEREGTSLDSQKDACLAKAKELGYQVPSDCILLEAFSGATLDRPKLTELREWVRNKEIDAVIAYALDRLSRDPVDFIILQDEIEKAGLKLIFVTEDVDTSDMGKLISHIRGFAAKLEREKISERTMRGKNANAQQGVIPSGFGRYGGYFGLQYDKDSKAFKHIPSQIDIAKEILERHSKGESANSITRNLQSRNIHGLSGALLHRSAIHRILHHARVYAGILKWNDIEIPGKVEPIISLEVADAIEKQLQLNREHSFGFGKRKWFSGRVFCGVCNRRYILDKKKGCHCGANDKRSPIHCDSPKVSFSTLEKVLSKALLLAYTNEEAVVKRAKEAYQNWEHEMAGLQNRQVLLEHELSLLDERRHRISRQMELGGLTEDEYSERLGEIKSRQDEVLLAIDDIKKFKTEKPIPAEPEKIRAGFNWLKRLHEQEPLLILLGKNQDKHRLGERLADILKFKSTIIPGNDSYKIEIRVNLPLEAIRIEGQSIEAIVFGSILRTENNHSLALLFNVNPKNEVVESLLVGVSI